MIEFLQDGKGPDCRVKIVSALSQVVWPRKLEPELKQSWNPQLTTGASQQDWPETTTRLIGDP